MLLRWTSHMFVCKSSLLCADHWADMTCTWCYCYRYKCTTQWCTIRKGNRNECHRKSAIKSHVQTGKLMMNMTLVHNVHNVEVFKPSFAHGSAHDDTVAIVWLATIWCSTFCNQCSEGFFYFWRNKNLNRVIMLFTGIRSYSSFWRLNVFCIWCA